MQGVRKILRNHNIKNILNCLCKVRSAVAIYAGIYKKLEKQFKKQIIFFNLPIFHQVLRAWLIVPLFGKSLSRLGHFKVFSHHDVLGQRRNMEIISLQLF